MGKSAKKGASPNQRTKTSKGSYGLWIISAILIAIFAGFLFMLLSPESSQSSKSRKKNAPNDEYTENSMFFLPPDAKTSDTVNVQYVLQDRVETFKVDRTELQDMISFNALLRGRADPKRQNIENGAEYELTQLAALVQKTILEIYSYELFREFTPVAVRESRKHLRMYHIFRTHNNTASVSRAFDTSRINSLLQKNKCDDLSAKVATIHKNRVMNFTFAYILSLLLTSGFRIKAPDGGLVKTLYLSTGQLTLKHFEHLILIDGFSEKDTFDALRLFDTKEGRIEAIDNPGSMQNMRVKSINPLVDVKSDIVQNSDGHWINHVWTTVGVEGGRSV
ncbi:hypothetical protein AKO1_002721 [Acrasis kona]|uniref:Uncharacterized protein n=1 Tax=Acrasis kona TaxID=1008807 RepID=A0AAW2YJB8_9EUKA